jgi:hemoglobin
MQAAVPYPSPGQPLEPNMTRPLLYLLLACTTAFTLPGCAGQPPSEPTGDASTKAATAPVAAKDTLYERLGGAPAVERFVDALIAHCASDPQVAPLFKDTDIPYFRARLIEQVCNATGGGCEYTGLSMEEAHSGLAITDAEFDHFAGLAQASLSEAGIAKAPADELMGILASLRGDVTGQ